MFFKSLGLYYNIEMPFIYSGAAEGLGVHILIQGLVKKGVLLLYLAKYGDAPVPCAPLVPPPLSLSAKQQHHRPSNLY
jgi:hypothetical protein